MPSPVASLIPLSVADLTNHQPDSAMPSAHLVPTTDGFTIAFQTSALLPPDPSKTPSVPPSPQASPDSTTTVKGLPFKSSERRLWVLIQDTKNIGSHNDRSFVLSVNSQGACNLSGDGLAEADQAACTVELKKQIDGFICDAKTFCGLATVQWSVVYERIRPHIPTIFPGSNVNETLSVCLAYSDGQSDAYTNGKPNGNKCSSTTIVIASENGAWDHDQYLLGYTFGDGNAKTTGSAAASDASSALRRRPQASVSPAASASPSTQNQLLNVNASLPLWYTTRLDLTAARIDTASLLSRLNQNAAAAVNGGGSQYLPPSGNLNCPDPCSDADFKSVDADAFVTSPSFYRQGSAPSFGAEQIDQVPFDLQNVPQLNYGAKLVVHAGDARGAFGWYDDLTHRSDGTAFHIDSDFENWATVGLTQVVGNADPTLSTNKYQTSTHTVNTVVAATAHLLDDTVDLSGRWGSDGSAEDHLAVLSYAPLNGGARVSDAGATQGFQVALGYRSVDADYTPLGAVLDQFIGTQSVFGTVAFLRTPAGSVDKSVSESLLDPQLKLSLSGARAWSPEGPAYDALIADASATVAKNLSLYISQTTSSIAGGVFAKQAGSVLVSGVNAAQMLLNKKQTVTLKLDDTEKTGWLFSAGPAWSDAPSKCYAPGPAGPEPAQTSAYCTYAPLKSGTFELKYLREKEPWNFDLTSDFAPIQQTKFGQKSVVANQYDPKAVVTVDLYCGKKFRVGPSFTADANTAEDGSSYSPGVLLEGSADFGFALLDSAPGSVIRVSYKRSLSPQYALLPASTTALFVELTNDAASESFYTRCNPKGKPGSGPSLIGHEKT